MFDSLGATWVINDGVLRNDDLLLKLANYEARGAGQVGLGQQTIDYVFTPVALRANAGNGIAIPVRMIGPWSDVSIRPDLEAAIDLNLGFETGRGKGATGNPSQRGGAAQLAEELDVTEPGQDVEDAAKQKLEDEVKRGLLKLFD